MPRLTKLYTKSGDEGTTALGSRQRVPKDSLRVIAYGDVDELNSVIGVALTAELSPHLSDFLADIQNELFHLGSDLAFPEGAEQNIAHPQIEARHVDKLEAVIDDLSATVGALENFIIPGGTVGAAHLHVARTVCRRAERAVVTLARQEKLGQHVVPYLNRLSDALFVMARLDNHEKGVPEPLWDSRA